MKVALLSDCFLPRLGGIEVQVHGLATRLLAAGHRVEVFTATPGAGGERHGVVEDVDGIPVHRLAIGLPWELPVNPLAPPEVRRRLTGGGFDVAHVHMGVVSPFATDMARVALGAGLPTAITWHCLMEASQPMFRALGHARRWGRAGAALSAVSGVAAESVRAVAGGADVGVLSDGVDVASWARPAGYAEVPVPGGDAPVRVVTAMRLAARKRPRAVVEAVSVARGLGAPRMRVEILGDGPERGALERRIARLGLDGQVVLPGRVGREELRHRYWDAEVYLAPARLEAFGLAAAEARSAGLPVIGRAGNGIGDFVQDGVTGLLVDDDVAFAQALARVTLDSGLRTRLGRASRESPPTQDWPQVLDATLAEYARAGAR